ncbi:class I SAM-dependent methyltransferase [Microbulbifer hydrolyticus]|uniref:Methyltransferase n=1 Tax=Microbulbifer hydrolyticus TaxID=48074 RepID=A0A6P1TB98_9GAMM|nr:methyltransferase [Microbulbifer hydrolyticus]MBB5210613.1 16S rRNA (guanine1207-N2)-methyltransferase [Microbulbifer hydrolyticus]QHQ38923.1 methyltransferase [Microbulbifer hydrolyticus]
MAILLSQLLEQDPEHTLWIADENSRSLLEQGFSFGGDLLTNRWDIAQLAEHSVKRATFNDFDFAALETRYRRIVFPVSKEKAITHHVINSAPNVLLPEGELFLLGRKNSGIKTYAVKAAKYLGTEKNLLKDGQDYLGSLLLPPESNLGEPLQDSGYTLLQQPAALEGLFSKPGQFGWNKVDTGSALLARHFTDHHPNAGASVVDLGCGYGYLSTQLATYDHFRFIATDNNAAALHACEKNFAAQDIQGEVIAGDVGSEIESGSADFLVCNPPFHQGFQVEGDLTDRFLQQAARILRSGGTALFVVNEFIPVARKAQGRFAIIETLEETQGFCIYRLQKS